VVFEGREAQKNPQRYGTKPVSLVMVFQFGVAVIKATLRSTSGWAGVEGSAGVRFRLLRLPAGYHQARTGDDQNGADDGRDLLIVFGGDADVCVSEVNAMTFRVWDRDKERNDPENGQQYSN
jgi:hypothetical protein